LLDFLIGSHDLFIETGVTSGEQLDDQFMLPPPNITANTNINRLPTPQQVHVNNMVGNIHFGNINKLPLLMF